MIFFFGGGGGPKIGVSWTVNGEKGGGLRDYPVTSSPIRNTNGY